MPWGIPVPEDPDHVMYVCLDALVNYVSTLVGLMTTVILASSGLASK